MHFYSDLNLLICIIRQIYWIIRAKKITKNCNNCVTCCRYRAVFNKQLMRDLPFYRVASCRPFSACGSDYAGPTNLLKYQGRGAKITKRYIVLFVCFATKSLHLEFLRDLTSEVSIASLNRCCSRRGNHQHIYSDNGTTFVGTKRQLSDLHKFICSINKNEKKSYLSQRNIKWHMILPISPHFDGQWNSLFVL